MKALGIDHVERFPFPTPPPGNAVRNAVTLLTNLGAIATCSPSNSASKTGTGDADLTAAIAMATMSAMKSGSALHKKQLLQLQHLAKSQQLRREQTPLTALGRVIARFPLNLSRYAPPGMRVKGP